MPINLPVAQLGVAAQQLTEIVKAVSRRIRILVMDEPTARLSAKERDRLFAIMRDLTAKGVGIIYVSHFLEEIFTVADRVTTLRDGHVIDRSAVGDLTLARLTELMTRGRRARRQRTDQRSAQRRSRPQAPRFRRSRPRRPD